MSYTLSPSEDQQYIILKHQGTINGQLAMQRVREAHILGDRLGITRYLVDLTEVQNEDTITDSYRYAYEDMQTPLEVNPKARVAMLVGVEDHSHDFVETVLRNAGHNVTLFRERELAIQHLLHE